MRPWASATFMGTRHRVVLRAMPAATLDAWLAGLPEAELRLRGHLVADVVVENDTAAGDARRITLAVLTLVEG